MVLPRPSFRGSLQRHTVSLGSGHQVDGSHYISLSSKNSGDVPRRSRFGLFYKGWKRALETLTIACAEDSRERNNMMLKSPTKGMKAFQTQLRGSSLKS